MTTARIPEAIRQQLCLADPSWHPILEKGLAAIMQASPGYLSDLANSHYMPTQGRLFAAFAQPLQDVRFVLFGEGPYPREDSATGVCFMDGAVTQLWSDKGLSKQANRATSLRNFIKMLMVADGQLDVAHTTGDAMAGLAARVPALRLVRTLPQLQDNLHHAGFLLLNASLVFRKEVAPVKDARAWQPFLQQVLQGLADAHPQTPPTLVLWGKIAEQLKALPQTALFPQAASEHPYNLSFIGNATMQQLFVPMHLMQDRSASPATTTAQSELFEV